MVELTEQQQKIVNRAGTLADGVIAEYAAGVDERSEFPHDSMAALRDEGFLGLMVPKDYGGLGQDLRTMTAVLEVIAAKCASTALCYLVHLGGAAAYAAADPPKADLLHAIGKGDHLTTLALGEFGSRSHFWAPLSKAKRQNGSLVLDAAKAFVTSAGHTDGYVVITRSPESEAPTDSTFYYVPSDMPGIKVSARWDALGMRGNASAPMRFNEIKLSEGNELTDSGKGMDLLLEHILPIINLGVAAICNGIAEASIDITQKHMLGSQLEHLSLRLADLGNERARLARMRLEADKAKAHLAVTLDAVERGAENMSLMILESKVAAADMVLKVTDLGMKALGGTAFNRHLGLERRFRDARAADVTGVTSDLLLDFMGRTMLDMPLL
jgi:alkylation response protein AidB-like acyl-CoA dehydrogenase